MRRTPVPSWASCRQSLQNRCGKAKQWILGAVKSCVAPMGFPGNLGRQLMLPDPVLQKAAGEDASTQGAPSRLDGAQSWEPTLHKRLSTDGFQLHWSH